MKSLITKLLIMLSLFIGTTDLSFALPACPSSGYFHNCFGTYTWTNGAKYVGEWQNDKLHGQGTRTYANGDKYVGEYKDGKKHGQGSYTFTNGDKYVGEWKNDNKHGQGTATWADGEKYVGEWKNDNKHGYAITYYADGSIHQEGIFKDDKFLYEEKRNATNSTLPACPSSGYFHNCYGTYVWDTGDKYVGEWKNDNKHGQGTFTFTDGEKYVGEFKDDKMHGQGTYIYASGAKEVGEFKDDKLNGYAITYYADGSIHQEGIFKDDKFLYAKTKDDTVLKNEFNKLSLIDREIIQKFLASRKYYTGKIDGKWGEKTKKALKSQFGYSSKMNQSYWVQNEFEKILLTATASKADKNLTQIANEELCWSARIYKNGKYHWRTSYQQSNYVKEAKQRGLTCGVGQTVTTVTTSKADNNLTQIANEELCWSARIYKNGKYHWRTNSQQIKYVKEAKRRGLTCGVKTATPSSSATATTTTPKPKTCENDPTLCTVAQLCSKASHYSGGKKAWRKDYSSKKYVTEAKNNGVTCGVKIVTAKVYNCNDGPSYCTASQLCSKASHYSGGKKVWKKDYSAKQYVTEAKSLGVSCGVKIEVAQPKKEELLPAASGSGFFVSNEGHIVTNEHVIEGCEIVKVHQRGEIVESKVITFDRYNDLALIKINQNPEVVFSLTDQPPYLDQDIRAAGYPLVSDLGTNLKVTRGVVSALSAVNDITRFQMDVAVQPGNSGGPIFDNEGNILGVVVSRLINETAQNVNFGIKAATVRSLLNSNGVDLLPPNKNPINKRKFSEFMRKGTVLLSCWMTLAEIEKAQKKDTGKVFFKEFQK